ncbi:MAG: hypothetical protein CVT97_03560, partial [Bacteroidetes bacterium HGW-Bacteroidetes-14]
DGAGFPAPPPDAATLAPQATPPASIPWCPAGIYLATRPVFTLDPALHAGAYYVQEPSSMIIELLKPFLEKMDLNLRLLDLCAAPGGKSTHLASIMPQGSKLVANEVIRPRAAILRENISRWGLPNVEVTSMDPSQFAPRGYEFDFILVDAPCSGEGMFRKDPESVKEWSPESVQLCASRQQRIVADIWPSLEPGGLLAYSTCTMNRSENEENVAWIIETLGAERVSFDPEILSQLRSNGVIVTPQGELRLHPGLVKGEGLFFALLRKHADSLPPEQLPQKSAESRFPNSRINDFKSETQKSDNFKSGYQKSSASGYNFNNSDRSNKKFAQSGKSQKSNFQQQNSPAQNLQPEHEMALSTNYSGEWPSVEVTKEQALTYLSKGTLNLPDAPLGYLRITYGGLGLGFVKNIGSRANNLLPPNLRIRMQF